MGALEAPQDRHGQEHRTETSRAERNRQTEAKAEPGALEAMAEPGALKAMAEPGALKAMAEPGAQEAMAGGSRGRGLVPWPGHSSRNPSNPPQKKFHGAARGNQEPSGARHRNRTGQESPPGLNTQTGQ